MSILPYNNLRDNSERSMTAAFLGYNHSLVTADGEWYDMRNLTSRYYPVLSPRPPRGELQRVEKLQGFLGKDKLIYVADNKLYYDGEEIVDLTEGRYELLVTKPDDWDSNAQRYFVDKNGTRVKNGAAWTENAYLRNDYYDVERTLVSLGGTVVIFPDKRQFNPFTNEVSFLELEKSNFIRFSGDLPGECQFTPCDRYGNTYESSLYTLLTSHPDDWEEQYQSYYICYSGQYYLNDGSSPNQYSSPLWKINTFYYKRDLYSTTPPPFAVDGDIWIDTSDEENPITKQYSGNGKMWISLTTSYFKVSRDGISDGFKEGDVVSLSLSGDGDYLNGDYVIHKVEDNALVLIGALRAEFNAQRNTVVTIQRTVPDMDFVIEGENRLWGCRYGISSKTGEFVNEIYACKLGDASNWHSYRGISTDSYAVSVGSDGPFTGAAFYGGMPVFFKERYMHRVSGSVPSGYAVYTNVIEGVQKGSCKSLAVVNGVLFYKSPIGVMAFSEGYPSCVSSVFGDEKYYEAVAGALGGKLYMSMRLKNGEYQLFVFDSEKGMWHIEDDTRALDFARVGDVLYCRTEDGYYACEGEDAHPFEWYAESGILGLSSPDQMYIDAINIRASLEAQSRIAVFIQYDSNGKWEACGGITGEQFCSERIVIRPRRCDHYALRIEGKGQCKIYSITKTYENGGEKRW